MAEVSRPPGRLRIGFCLDHPLPGRAVAPACAQALTEAATLLTELGHVVEPVPLPWDGQAVARDFLLLYFGETAATRGCTRVGTESIGRKICARVGVSQNERFPATWPARRNARPSYRLNVLFPCLTKLCSRIFAAVTL